MNVTTEASTPTQKRHETKKTAIVRRKDRKFVLILLVPIAFAMALSAGLAIQNANQQKAESAAAAQRGK